MVDVVVANAHEFANIYGHGQYFYNSTIGNTLLLVYVMMHFDISMFCMLANVPMLRIVEERNGVNHKKNWSIF